jgi:glycopeptide antibiotics resistance protein
LPRAIDSLEPHYALIAGGIAVAILYGSFYPFGFYAHHDPRGPLGVLLESEFRNTSRDDAVANILLYIPFGFFAAYALGKRALLGAACAGFALSLFVELVQFYDHGRYQELSDLCCNTLGTVVGAAAAIAARRRVSDVFAALLLLCWFASRFYPAAPQASAIPALDLARYFVAWLAVGSILATFFAARFTLPLMLAITLLVRTLTAYVEPAEITGGSVAALLWTGVLWRVRSRDKIIAILFVALIVLLALAPFHFSAVPREFGWVPFVGFLGAPELAAIRVFFEKGFLYGGLIWLLVRAGFSIGAAAALGALLVFSLRLFQVYLPDRSAEITDAVLLLMLAATMKLIALARQVKF